MSYAVGTVTAASSLAWFLGLIRDTLVPFKWRHLLVVIPNWSWRTWLTIWSISIVLVMLEGCYRVVRKRENLIATGNRHQLEQEENIGKLTDTVASQTVKTLELERQLSELRNSYDQLEKVNQELKAELEKRAQLSVSLRTEKTPRAIGMGSSQDVNSQRIEVRVTEITLLIYNHGEKPVVVRGCKLWELHAIEAIQDFELHGVVTSDVPKEADITELLLRTISGKSTLNFSSLQGKHTVRVVIKYSDGSTHKEAEPQNFQVICGRWMGGPTLRIDAHEIIDQQS